MTRLRNKDQPWRVLWLIPIALAAALSIVATGGGGGGGGDSGIVVDDGDDVPVTILPNYNFFLANLAGDQLLTASVGNLFTASLDIDGLFPGNLDLNTDVNNNVTFVSYRIRQTARVDVTVTPIMPTALEGTFTVVVNEDIAALFGTTRT